MIYILQGITAEKKLKTQVISKTKNDKFKIETESSEESVDYDENDEDKKHSERINYFRFISFIYIFVFRGGLQEKYRRNYILIEKCFSLAK